MTPMMEPVESTQSEVEAQGGRTEKHKEYKIKGGTMSEEKVLVDEQHKLPRSGDLPVFFKGKLLVTKNNQFRRGNQQIRWHQISVYQTTNGRYVVYIACRTAWAGELDQDEVHVANDLNQVAGILLNHSDSRSYRDLVASIMDHFGMAEMID